MRVLVTGGAGFIGSHLVDLLVSRGHEVTVIDNLDPQVHGPAAREPRHIAAYLTRGQVRFVRGDVTNRENLATSLEGVEAVVHLAAAVGVGQSMYEPYYYVHTNATGSGLLLDLVAKAGSKIQKLIVASSMSIYGEGAYRCPTCGGGERRERDERQLQAARWEVACAGCGADLEPIPTPETKVPEIASVYAATKKHQEDLFVSFGRAYGIPTFALRFFNVFGSRQSLGNPYTGVAAIFLSRFLNGRPPLIFEDGGQSRDFIDVRDVANALLMAVEFPGKGAHVLNLGTSRRTTVAQVAEALASHLGLEVRPQILGKYRAGDIRHCIADTAEARRVLGFEARRSFAEGLPDLVDWCRNEQPRDGVDTSLAELMRKGLIR
jgi:dTDP-L-rhamnose 4-epimerase